MRPAQAEQDEHFADRQPRGRCLRHGILDCEHRYGGDHPEAADEAARPARTEAQERIAAQIADRAGATAIDRARGIRRRCRAAASQRAAVV